jgi:hypothetical protein
MSINVDTGDLENGTIERGNVNIKLFICVNLAWIPVWSKRRCDMNFQCIVGFVYCKKFAIKNFPNFLVCYGKKKPMVH